MSSCLVCCLFTFLSLFVVLLSFLPRFLLFSSLVIFLFILPAAFVLVPPFCGVVCRKPPPRSAVSRCLTRNRLPRAFLCTVTNLKPSQRSIEFSADRRYFLVSCLYSCSMFCSFVLFSFSDIFPPMFLSESLPYFYLGYVHLEVTARTAADQFLPDTQQVDHHECQVFTS